MKIKIQKNKLVSALSDALFLTKRKTTIPALSCILLKSTKEKTIVISSDSESFLFQNVEAENIKDGEILLPAKRFFDVIRSLTSEDVVIDSGDSFNAQIKGGKSSFNIMGCEPNTFPVVVEDVPNSTQAVLPGNVLARLIQNTSFCVSEDGSRPVLGGISCELIEDGYVVSLTSSDGNRLSKDFARFDFRSPQDTKVKVLIPKWVATEAARFLSSSDFKLIFGQNIIRFEFNNGGTVFVSRLIDLDFPDVKYIMSKSFDKTVSLNKEEILSVVKRAQLVTATPKHPIKLKWTKNNLNISANTSDIGSINEDIAVKYSHEPFDVYLSPQYFIEAIESLKTDSFDLSFSDSQSPMKINFENYIHILMPMNVGGV